MYGRPNKKTHGQNRWSTYIWNAKLSVASDDLLQSIGAVVAVFAQMEAERPIGRHYRPTNHGCVLVDDVVGLRAKEYIHVEYAADGTIGYSWQRLQFHFCNTDIHTYMHRQILYSLDDKSYF